jgi:predicted RND superfamily exporter protein
LPALLVTAERLHLVLPEAQLAHEKPVESSVPDTPFPAARTIVLTTVILAIVALTVAPRLHFEYEFGKLEPHFPVYDSLRAKEGRVYASGRRNPAFLVLDRLEDIPATTEILRQRAEADTVSPTILSIESLQERYPLEPEKQQIRLEHLARIRRLLDDPFLRALGSSDVERLRRASRTTEPVPLDSVPDFLKTMFTTKSGELGTYVIVYPSVGLSDGRRSMEFAEDVGQVQLESGKVYTAASTSIVAANMLRLLLDESPWMVLLTSAVLVVILLFMFRSWKLTLLALFPLIVGTIWMLGLLMASGVRLSFYNLVVLPAMLGIGVDGGVHIVHRFVSDGHGSLRNILRSTGEHVFVGSMTTLIAFAWWLFSHHPGLNSIGQLAVMGIGSVLIAGLVSLPALLQVIENRRRKPETINPEEEHP